MKVDSYRQCNYNITALKKSCMAGGNIGIKYIFLISHLFAVVLRRIGVFLLSNLFWLNSHILAGIWYITFP